MKKTTVKPKIFDLDDDTVVLIGARFKGTSGKRRAFTRSIATRKKIRMVSRTKNGEI